MSLKFEINIIYIILFPYLGTAVAQIGSSLVRSQMVSLEFFFRPNTSDCTMALGSIQPLTEMSTRNIFWGIKAAGV